MNFMMLGTIINNCPCARRVVAGETFGARGHRVRPRIDSGDTDKGECNQDNQTSE